MNGAHVGGEMAFVGLIRTAEFGGHQLAIS